MKNLFTSKRAGSTPFSPIRKLHAYAAMAKKNGINVYHLNIGQPDLPTPTIYFHTLGQLTEEGDGKTVGYAPSFGFGKTNAAWQKYYRDFGLDFGQDEIITTVGGSEAILFALLAVTDPGDEAVVFEPTYPNYLSMCHMASVAVKPIRLVQADNYHLPSDETIMQALTPRTKAVIICNPANPTGTLLTPEEQQRIVRLAVKNNLWIIADETYREIIFDGQPFVSLMQFTEARQNIIIVDSVSKRFNLCGARIGCLASQNSEVIEQVQKFAQARLSAPSLEQLAVIPLLEDAKKHSQFMVDEFSRRRRVLIAGLDRLPGIKYSRPDGAFYSMLTLPVADAEHFCQWLVQDFSDHRETIMLAPGSGFYTSPDQGLRQARIAYVLGEKKLQRALEILTIGLEKYSKK